MNKKINYLYEKIKSNKNMVTGVAFGVLAISFISVVVLIVNVTGNKKDNIPISGIIVDTTTTYNETNTTILSEEESYTEELTSKEDSEETTDIEDDTTSNKTNNKVEANNTTQGSTNNNVQEATSSNNTNNNTNNNTSNNTNNNSNNSNGSNSETKATSLVPNTPSFVGHDNQYWTLPLPNLPAKGKWADLNVEFYTKTLLAGLNSQRQTMGNPPTTTNQYLNELAQYQARYMAIKQSCFHTPHEIASWHEACSADISSPYFYKKYTQYQSEVDNPYRGSVDYALFFDGETISGPQCMACYDDELHGQGYVLGRHTQTLSIRKNMIVGIGVAMDYQGNVYICINGLEKEDIEYTVEEDEGVIRYPFMEDVEAARQFYKSVGCK